MRRGRSPRTTDSVNATAVSTVSTRAVVIGLLMAGLLCAVTPYNNFKVAATLLGGNQFPVFGFFTLLVLALPVNGVLRALPHRIGWLRPFVPAEMLTVWAMILVAAGLPSSGMMRTFLVNIVAPHFYSDPRNDWEAKVWGKEPGWLQVHDAEAAKAFFSGYPRGTEHVPWAAWIGPLFGWGIFAVCFLCASFCVANVLRRQWIEAERFAFPLVALPLLVAEEPEEGKRVNRLLRSPLLWIAVVGVCALHSLKGMHLLYPTIPELPLSWDLRGLASESPWNQIDRFEASVYFLVIGVSFLLPSEVCLSLWLFFLFYKAEILLGALYNWDMPISLSGYSWKQFHSLEAFGGAIALVIGVVWSARRHLRGLWEAAFTSARPPSETRDMFGPRVTVFGLALSYGGMALWEAAAGIPPVLILLSLVLITMALVVIGWATCQAGLLFMAMPFSAIDVLAPTVGTAPFPTHALYTQYRAEGAFVYNTRELLLPGILGGLKAGEATATPGRRLFGALALSVALGVVVSGVASLWLPYHNGGGLSLTNKWTYQDGPLIPLRLFGGAAGRPMLPSTGASLLHIAGGYVLVAGLLLLRARAGWGLHPIGFLSASTHAGHCLWFSLLLGWVAKSLILRYGGMRGYAAALPVFLGLIVGDAISAAFWTVVGLLTGTGYNLLPT